MIEGSLFSWQVNQILFGKIRLGRRKIDGKVKSVLLFKAIGHYLSYLFDASTTGIGDHHLSCK